MYDTIIIGADIIRQLALDFYDTLIRSIRVQEEQKKQEDEFATDHLGTSSDKEVQA